MTGMRLEFSFSNDVYRERGTRPALLEMVLALFGLAGLLEGTNERCKGTALLYCCTVQCQPSFILETTSERSTGRPTVRMTVYVTS